MNIGSWMCGIVLQKAHRMGPQNRRRTDDFGEERVQKRKQCCFEFLVKPSPAHSSAENKGAPSVTLIRSKGKLVVPFGAEKHEAKASIGQSNMSAIASIVKFYRLQKPPS
ncbi:hypothetical protein ACHAXS_003957 [Conticribra weissflogii]